MQPPIPPRSRDRVARLRLPELPPRDLERMASVNTGPHSAPAPSTTAPDSAGYLPAASKFGAEGSPADVRGYTVTPLLMRGGVVSPGVGGGSGLVLPTLSLPLTSTSSALPPASQIPLHHRQQQQQPQPTSPPPPSAPPTMTINSQQQQQHIMSTSSSSLSNQQQQQQQQQQQHQQQHVYVPSSSQQQTIGISHQVQHYQNGKTSPPPHHLPQAMTSSTSIVSGGGGASRGGVANVSGARTTPSSPVGACGLTQNEIKKAQNRKSAKRFREAQKQRWKNMADDLMSHKRIIDELRAQLAAQANTVAHANNALRASQLQQQQQQQQQQNQHHQNNNDSYNAPRNSMDAKRSSVSINDLVDVDSANTSATANRDGGSTTAGNNNDSNSHQNSHAEAEAALYAQILSSKTNGLSCSTNNHNSHLMASNCSISLPKDRFSTSTMEDITTEKNLIDSDKGGGSGGEPYAKELGVLKWCTVVEKSCARIVSVRRGSRNGVGSSATDGLSADSATEFTNALACGKTVTIRFNRNCERVHAVMNPVDGCDRVVVAEFTPF